MNDVLFYYGSKEKFDALPTKNADTLYFLTDTLQLFKGDEEYTKTVKLVSSLPTSGQRQGIVYVNTSNFTAHVYDGTEFHRLSQPTVTEIPSTGATDENVPTTKAVADYVAAKLGEIDNTEGCVTAVTYTAATGTMGVTKDGTTTNTVLSGVINNPTYDNTTRTITLPVFGGDALVIELGKDAVVSSGSYNADTETIDLVLTSGDPVSIPVTALIDIYTGIATASASVTVSSDNKISVNVKVSATANNQITLEEDGLYVPLPDAYTKAEMDAKLKTITDDLTAHKNDTTVHITTAERTEWNAKATTDDVATAKSEAIAAAAADATSKADNALAAAKTYADTAKDAAISAAATDATTKANQALADAKSYADGLNTAMDERVSATERALTWQSL